MRRRRASINTMATWHPIVSRTNTHRATRLSAQTTTLLVMKNLLTRRRRPTPPRTMSLSSNPWSKQPPEMRDAPAPADDIQHPSDKHDSAQSSRRLLARRATALDIVSIVELAKVTMGVVTLRLCAVEPLSAEVIDPVRGHARHNACALDLCAPRSTCPLGATARGSGGIHAWPRQRARRCCLVGASLEALQKSISGFARQQAQSRGRSDIWAESPP